MPELIGTVIVSVPLSDVLMAERIIVPAVPEFPNFRISSKDPAKLNVPAVEDKTEDEL
jgi:hypothetical protein